jgi:general secretion pathway protein K
MNPMRTSCAPGLPPRRRRRSSKRGIALIMVMGAVAVLTVMLAEFQDDASMEVAAATADRDAVQAEYMAKSALNLARLLIAAEPTIRSAIAPLFMLMKKTPPQLPVWEYSDKILGAFNDSESSKDFAGSVGVDVSTGKNLGMPGGRWELTIIDEDSKINVNLGASNDIAHIRLAKEIMGMIARPQFNPLFEQKDATGQFHDRLTTCSAIIDWADADENLFSCDVQVAAPGSSGVEDAWYQLLRKPFRRKNAPYDSIEELHMVRGVSEDFWATFVDPQPTDPRKRLMTVWGQGLVNVNTAEPQTLHALVCSGAPQAEICTDLNQAQTFIMGFTMARGITMGAPLFGSANDFVQTMTGKGQIGPMLAALGMKPVKFQSESEFAKAITIESKMFGIHAHGIVKGYKRETRVRVQAVVDFRSAPSIAQTGGLAGFGATPTPGASAVPTAGLPGVGGAATQGKVDPNAITGAVQPNPGGTVVYYRVD